MPLRGPQSPQGRPSHNWHHWRRWPHYWNYYDYDYDWYDYDWYDYDWYDWDYDYYDWDYTESRPQARPSRPRPQKMGNYFKVDPMLMGNLLECASTYQSSQEDIQGMLDRMMELSNVEGGHILNMEDYTIIVADTSKNMSSPSIDK
jgi:hypothetical protein